MAASKRTRKKYNPHKNIQRATKAVLGNTYAIWHTFDDKKAELFHRNGQRVRMTPTIVTALTEYRYEWSLFLAAFGVDQWGKPYMKSEAILSKEQYTHAELCDFLNERHLEIIDGMNKNQFIGAGWIASIKGTDLSEQEAFAWFDKLGLSTVAQQAIDQDNEDAA